MEPQDVYFLGCALRCCLLSSGTQLVQQAPSLAQTARCGTVLESRQGHLWACPVLSAAFPGPTEGVEAEG